MLTSVIKKILSGIGYTVIKEDNVYADIKSDKDFMELYSQCKPYTMTSIERMYSLYNAIQYCIKNKINGDFVECGVWRGGSSMMIALTLKKLQVTDRKVYMYDTYEGMSEPTENDFAHNGEKAEVLLKNERKDEKSKTWCLASVEDVEQNLRTVGYPSENIIIIKGKVEDTIPKRIPETIALLRLDTDWYESTKHELVHLYPLLQSKGILIIDDFGHWQGAKKATIEYITDNKLEILLNRIDYTGRIGIKL